ERISVTMESPAQPVTDPIAEESEDLQPLWARLIEAVGRASPFTRSYLLEAHPVSFTRNIFTIGFDPEFEDHIGLVDNARNHALLQTKLSELGHANLQFKFIKAQAAARRPEVSLPPALAPTPMAVPVPAPARLAAAAMPSPKQK